MCVRSLVFLGSFLLQSWTLCFAGIWPDVQTLDRQSAALRETLKGLPPAPAMTPPLRSGFHSRYTKTDRAAGWVQIDLGQTSDFDLVSVIPATSNGSEPYGMPPRYRVDVSDQADFSAYHTLLDQTESDDIGGMTLAPIAIPCAGTRARYVRFTATRMALQSLDRGFFCLGELFVFLGELNLGAGRHVIFSGTLETQPTWDDENLTDGITALGAPVLPDLVRSNGWHSGIEASQDVLKWVQIDLGQAHVLDELRLFPAHPPDFPDRHGFGFPLRFRVDVSSTADFESSQTVFDATKTDYLNPADNPVAIPLTGVQARYVRIVATKLWQRTSDFIFALAETQVFAGGKNIALVSTVTSLDETRTPSWASEFLVDDRTSSGHLVSWPNWLLGLAQRAHLTAQLASLQTDRNAAAARRQQTSFLLVVAVGFAIVLSLGILQVSQRLSQRRSLASLRQQIARDLHDEIGSSLGSISLMSELAMRDGDNSAMEEVHRLSREAAESMRGIIWLVRESGTPTLERLVETMRQTAGSLLGKITWELHAPETKAPLSSSLEFHRHVFLFYKEVLHNIARHAEAKEVRIDVQWTRENFALSITDDGIGFDPDKALNGSGLENLRHRASTLGGVMSIQSAVHQGSRIELKTPLST